MPHLNLDLDYFEHRKTLRLVGQLGKGAEVLPIKLWRYCGKYHAEDGRLAGYTEQEIEAAAGWWGESGKAVGAMVDVGFLDRTTDGYQAHDWLENQGHIAAYKKKGRDMALARWGHAASNADSIATGDRPKRVKQCQNQRIEPTKPTKPKTPRPPKGEGGSVEFSDLIPEPLRTPRFLKAWEAWIKHRHERKPAYTAAAAERALPKMAAEGEAAAVERIDRSIMNGWQGLFFRDEKPAGTNGHDDPKAFAARAEQARLAREATHA